MSANSAHTISHVQAGDHERNGEQGSQLQQLPLRVKAPEKQRSVPKLVSRVC